MSKKPNSVNKNTNGTKNNGTNIKRIRCYSIACSFISLFFLVLSVFITVKVFTFPINDEPIIYIILAIFLFGFCIAFSIYLFFHFRQFLYVDNGKFILKDTFVTIKELDINECYYEISTLPTKYSKTIDNEKWICIYSWKETHKFEWGLTNSRKYNRIQVTYTEKNIRFIEQYLKKDFPKPKNDKHNK